MTEGQAEHWQKDDHYSLLFMILIGNFHFNIGSSCLLVLTCCWLIHMALSYKALCCRNPSLLLLSLLSQMTRWHTISPHTLIDTINSSCFGQLCVQIGSFQKSDVPFYRLSKTYLLLKAQIELKDIMSAVKLFCVPRVAIQSSCWASRSFSLFILKSYYIWTKPACLGILRNQLLPLSNHSPPSCSRTIVSMTSFWGLWAKWHFWQSLMRLGRSAGGKAARKTNNYFSVFWSPEEGTIVYCVCL